MTIKQLLIGTLMSATAFGTLIHRLPKKTDLETKPVVVAVKRVVPAKAKNKVEPRVTRRAPRKAAIEPRMTLSKVFD